MWRLLGRSALRFHLRQPWQLALALAGISLGVAVFVGIQIANRSAERAFALSSSTLRGNATHRLLPLAEDLHESVYEALVLAGFGPSAAPVLTIDVRIVDGNAVRAGAAGPDGSAPAGDGPDRSRFGDDPYGGIRYQLVGIDPIKELRFRRFFPVSDDPAGDYLRLMTVPGGVLVPASLKAALGIDDGARMTVTTGRRTAELVVLGEVRASQAGAEPPIIADIGTAQTLSGSGRLSRIDLSLTDTQASDLAARPPEGTVLVDADDRNPELESMTQAFTTNLTALGLLALVVGMFLIHATMSFSVIRRRGTIATLRALGLTRAEVVGALVVEAAVIGSAAGLAGAWLGRLLADGLIRLVLRTMNDLAFSRSVADAGAAGSTLVLGVALGIAATVVAAAIPAREAARLAPATAERRSDTERRARRQSRRFTRWAVPTLVLAAAILIVWPHNLVLAFVAIFLVLVAGAMCVPGMTTLSMRAAEPLARTLAGLPGTMAVRSVTASLSRTGIATAALAVAVATVMSIGLMVGSFRTSLIGWLDTTLTADLYVQLGGAGADEAAVDAWVDGIDGQPGVRGVSRTRRIVLPATAGDIALRAAAPGPDGWGLDLIDGYLPSWDERLSNGDSIVVTEPFAYRHRLSVGDKLTLPTQAGRRAFSIVAISREYNAAGSAVLMSLSTYRRHWLDRGLSSIGVHLAGSEAEADVVDAIRATAPPSLRPAIRSTQSIQRISLALFDRTFEVTAVLRALAGLIAFFGVLSAILALQLDRRREFQILRSIGMSLAQLREHVIVQTVLLGLAAGVAALPIGAALAWLLVYVINRRSFGWTMDFVPAAQPVVYGIGVALGAALLAGIAAALIGMRSDSGVMAHDE